MKTYSEMLHYIEGRDYENHFWNAMRGKPGHKEFIAKGAESYQWKHQRNQARPVCMQCLRHEIRRKQL